MASTKYSFTLSSDLYLKDPHSSEVGKQILSVGAKLILEMGLESFTAKKLAIAASTTEATVYKYFPNKHRLLQYYFQLYWTWLEQQIKVFTAIELDPEERLRKAVRVVGQIPKVAADPGLVSKEDLRLLVITEGSKAYHHVQVDEDNAKKLFAPFKSVVSVLAEMILTLNPEHPFPYALGTTVVEMAHNLEFYREHLPSLTDFPDDKQNQKLTEFLIQILFKSLK